MQYSLLLKFIVCPKCHTRLFLDIKYNQLVCYVDNLVFPIHQGIPVLLNQEDYRLVSLKNI